MSPATPLILNPGLGVIRSGPSTRRACAWVTIRPGQESEGKAAARFTSEEFESEPQRAMSLFVEALRHVFAAGKWEPLSDHGVLFHLANGHRLYAWSDAVLLRDSSDNEITCWVLADWANDAEQVVGEILGQLAAPCAEHAGDLRAA